jgi:hypothetical protein
MMDTIPIKTTFSRLLLICPLLCISFFIFPHSAEALKKSEGTEILAIGTGAIHGGNLAQAKEKALSQALMKGMEDYLVRRLGREGMVNNFQRLVQEIIPGARDGIENFHILAENRTEDAYKILVRIRINKKVIEEKLRIAGLVTMEGPAIRVLFMISETQEGQTRYWWKDPEEPSAMSAIELILHNAFQERGFSLINRQVNIPEVEFSDEMRSTDLTDENILTWGKLFSADVVIRGRTGIIDDKEVFLTLKAMSVNEGHLICQGMHIEPIETVPDGSAKISEALKKLANYLASKLTPAIFQAAGLGHKKTHILDVTLTGLKNYGQFVDFRNFLRKEVPGIKSVRQTRVRKNSISIEVEFEGDENKFIASVLNHENLPLLLDFSRTEDGKILLEVE